MLWAILSGTPKWVYALLIFLLVLGFIQSRPSKVKIKGLFLIPTFWTCISCYSIYTTHGSTLIGFTMWGVGILAAVGFGHVASIPKGAFYTKEDDTFFIPGSWTPLILMMIIFLTKNFVGASQAINKEHPLDYTNGISFILITSFIYGCFSGTFMSRSLVVWRTKKAVIQL